MCTKRIGLFLLIFSSLLRAETQAVSDYLRQLTPIVFSQGGGAFLPVNVLNGMSSGQVSPIIQFYITNDMVNKCAQEIMEKGVPAQLETYLSAKTKWEAAMCKMDKCYKQAWLVSMLPQMSNNAGFGGSADGGARELSRNLGENLVNIFASQQEGKRCGEGNSLDPQLCLIFMPPSLNEPVRQAEKQQYINRCNSL